MPPNTLFGTSIIWEVAHCTLNSNYNSNSHALKGSRVPEDKIKECGYFKKIFLKAREGSRHQTSILDYSYSFF